MPRKKFAFEKYLAAFQFGPQFCDGPTNRKVFAPRKSIA